MTLAGDRILRLSIGSEVLVSVEDVRLGSIMTCAQNGGGRYAAHRAARLRWVRH